MEWADVIKITVPIILFTLSGIFGLVKWITLREAAAQEKSEEAQKEYWEKVHDNLATLVSALGADLNQYKSSQGQQLDSLRREVGEVAQRLQEFREQVAGSYIKRDDWLQHAVNLERKVDQLRNDFHNEIRDVVKAIGNWSSKHGSQ